MSVLIDELLPVQLADELQDLAPRTVHQQGWKGFTNGELLKAASEAGFDAIVTGDLSMSFQQNLDKYRVGLVVVRARSNRMQDLTPLVPEIRQALRKLKPGQVIVVGA